MARPSGRNLSEEIVESATRLVQERGVNGFSYGDLAKDLGVKAPSIHHHFRTKQDLLAEVARRYRACLLYTSPSPRDKRQSRMPSSA